VGANIGACTVEFLSLTAAHVIAFEPNPLNLFHLTRTLTTHAGDAMGGHRVSLERFNTISLRKVQRTPDQHRFKFLFNCHGAPTAEEAARLQPCVHVLPVAAGDRAASLQIFTERSNAGNSIIEDDSDSGSLGLHEHLRGVPGQYRASMSSTVAVRRLDDVFAGGLSLKGARTFVKVDVQVRGRVNAASPRAPATPPAT
jgi:hypothetical protein